VIRVMQGDLARLPVDAVLRPADAMLGPVGPAAARLDEAGGESFAAQRRTTTPLEAGAAVVTGGGELDASYVLHVVVADQRGPGTRVSVRRALVSAWQRAGDWGLLRIAAPLLGAADGALTAADSAELLTETFPRPSGSGEEMQLTIVVAAEPEREVVEAFVRRMT
jgi:O-acetyl-ADP-ribose deacetylase (regulator of RNase III)